MSSFFDTPGPKYFIPDWDDRVDPQFDFLNETARNRGWEHEAYAHEIFESPPYDGILVSKVVEETSRQRKERLRRLGVHAALRVPAHFPVLGDCGAFGYIDQPVPPYSASDVIDYYTLCGFDLGVSVDHLIPTADHPDRELRYRITLKNAREFLREHARRKCSWIPVGAVQGWDPESYAEAAARTAKMGYRLIALGGLVRSSTREILDILHAVKPVLPKGVGLHLFGLSRTALLPELASHQVLSVDSASALRQAWLSPDQNYHTEEKNYCALRVPQSKGIKTLAADSGALKLERELLDALRGLDTGAVDSSVAWEKLERYTHLTVPEISSPRMKKMQLTMERRPWQSCSCSICRQWGVEVAIFRGNNRNRRRGFHNTWVFYQQFLRFRI